jgi:hypothetical protein
MSQEVAYTCTKSSSPEMYAGGLETVRIAFLSIVKTQYITMMDGAEWRYAFDAVGCRSLEQHTYFKLLFCFLQYIFSFLVASFHEED